MRKMSYLTFSLPMLSQCNTIHWNMTSQRHMGNFALRVFRSSWESKICGTKDNTQWKHRKKRQIPLCTHSEGGRRHTPMEVRKEASEKHF
jgi:hypothetical protein